jgi:hypothetical protein
MAGLITTLFSQIMIGETASTVVKNHPPPQHVKDNSRTEATTVLILKTTQNRLKPKKKLKPNTTHKVKRTVQYKKNK